MKLSFGSDTIKQTVKKVIAKILPDSESLRYLSYLPKIEKWKKSRNKNYRLFKTKHELYSYINGVILQEGAVNYLEFGVYKGRTMKHWSSLNKHEESLFWGFDTFSGLPEEWVNFTSTLKKFHFNTEGELPNIQDARVSFVKGLYQETLTPFLENRAFTAPLLLHIDCDLYSSTLYVLTQFNNFLVPGSILLFDEFSAMLHEYRALEDYCSSYIRDYEILACTKSPSEYFQGVAIRIK